MGTTIDQAVSVPSLITLFNTKTDYSRDSLGTLDPPPSAQSLLMNNLLSLCQKWAKGHRYAFFKAHSNANKNVYIQCNCSGEVQCLIMNPSGQKTASSTIMCPFGIKGSIPTSKKIANKTWTLEIQNSKHNHRASSNPLSYAAHKQLIPEEVDKIQKLLQSNLKPAQILPQLHTSDNKTYPTNKTIRNTLQKHCQNNCIGWLEPRSRWMV
jgi:hypothetical protein